MDSYNLAELAQTLFEEAGDAILLFDPDTEQILDVNPMTQRLSGYSRKELLRMQASYLFRSEVKGGLAHLRYAFRKTQEFHSQEDFLLRGKDDGVWVPINLSLARLHVKPKTLCVITARDVREQREAYAKLKLTEERLRTVITNSPVILFALDHAGAFTLCEGKGLDSMGLKSGDFMGRSIFDLYRKSPQLLRAIYRVLAGDSFTAMIEVESGPGAGKWFEMHFTPLRDRQEHVTGAIAIATDVTEHRRAEDALRESEAFYHSLVESLPQNILRKDVDGRFTFVNQRVCATLGKSREEVVGQTDFDLFPAALAEKYRRDDRWVMDTGELLETVEEHVTPTGDRLFVRIIKTPLYDAQRDVVGAQVIFWDVTRQIRTERGLALQHAVTRVLAESTTLRDTVQQILQVVCADLSWEAGAMWRVDRKAGLLRCDEFWCPPGSEIAAVEAPLRKTTLAPGVGLSGQVWTTGQAAWVADLTAETGGFAATVAARQGLRGCLAFPLCLGNEVLGAMAFYSRALQAPEDDLLPMLSTIGSQIGQFIERKQAEEALHASEELYRLLFERNLAGILRCTLDGKVLDCNDAFAHILGYSRDETRAHPAWGFCSRPDDGQDLVAEFRERPLLASRELCFRRKDGTPVWVLANLSLLEGQANGGVIQGTVIDITERKRAQEHEAKLQLARTIQQKLFPAAPPRLPGFDIGGASHPAEATGGDYFDYLPMPDGYLGMAIGDVSGHGFGPALLMASTHAYLRALALAHKDVGEILTLVNRVMVDEIESGRFVTLLLARLDPRTRSLVYSSAGHPSGFVFDAAGTLKTCLASTALPLGVMAESTFKASQPLALDPGDIVLLVTDGIVEAAADQVLFGTERILEVVRAHLRDSAQGIVGALYDAVRAFLGGEDPADDITAIVLKVTAAP